MKRVCIVTAILSVSTASYSIPFLERYPMLHNKLAYASLGDFPTPLQKCTSLSQEFGCKLFIKRDDLSGPLQSDGTRLFGGNKVRKLEFVLADAVQQRAQTILTLGCAGSNHALATTVYARQLGLDTVCLLAHQPNSWVVQRNLSLQQLYGAQLHYFDTTAQRTAAVEKFMQHIEQESGQLPYTIPPGASTPVGVLGFINAVFELQEQINSGKMEQPDCIYIPAGSMGSTVGLLIGLQLIGINTKVIGVAVEPDDNRLADTRALFQATCSLLASIDKSFNMLVWNPEHLVLHEHYYGDGYGQPTNATKQAIELFNCTEGIILEDTYSAKAAAALVEDAQSGVLKNKTVLFWNTFYGDSCSDLLQQVSCTDLPQEFHIYFP